MFVKTLSLSGSIPWSWYLSPRWASLPQVASVRFRDLAVLGSQRALTNPQTKKMSRMICQAHVLVQYEPIHPKKFQNRALRGFCTICIFVFFHWFSLGPTGIKGATDQMLPWKAPNGPKTLPMGISHDMMGPSKNQWKNTKMQIVQKPLSARFWIFFGVNGFILN